MSFRKKTAISSFLSLVLTLATNVVWGQSDQNQPLFDAEQASKASIEFNRDVRPILSKHCIACHGPDEGQRGADLRLDVRDEALAVIEPGDLESSEMWARVNAEDPDDRMPPLEHGGALNDREIATLGEWIKSGAKYAEHWSFVAPQKTPLPTLTIENRQWARNEIDYFVVDKLASLNLVPSQSAEPARLIRRVALDLTGLPPTKAMVDRFVALPDDATYESIVDELLASPTYGEHWAAMWLDLARYADTIGYAEDRHRSIWPWRDWVIRAFNANMPYDQFTIEQIAGDLLPDATTDQKLATAFHRNTLNNTEGGTSNEEFRVIAVKDRISTTVNVWMGLTLRCAECHSHKYDPISQKEYYQFLDFFNQTIDADTNDERPRIDVSPLGREEEWAVLDQEIEQLKDEIAAADPIWNRLQPMKAASREGASMSIRDRGDILVTGKNPDTDQYTVTYQLPAGTHAGIQLLVTPSKENGNHVGREPAGNFVLSQLKVEHVGDADAVPIKLTAASADHSQRGFDVVNVIRDTIDKKGWAVQRPGGNFGTARTAIFTFEEPLVLKKDSQMQLTMTFQSPWSKATFGQFAVASTSIENPAEKYKKKQLDPLQRRLEDATAKRNATISVPVMGATANRRTTRVMTRGSYLQPAEEVSAAVMEAFHPLPEPDAKDRLAVAKWLMDEQNPLTARVTINRFWARIFGMGIVETEEDFGTQGTPPSNQELLDWLAVDFQRNGWDVKRALKLMVMSSTYRQRAVADAKRIEIDPRNVYLSRGPRFRMRAEVIRDQALAVSGLLSRKLYGTPVYPPNPVKQVRSAFTGGTNWVESQGEDRYRRAIYTYLKRTSPHPLFETFDMATREVCNLRRIRTNTPLQSFMTLNDRTFIEAAQALAAKMYQHSDQPIEQIKFGFELALLREGRAEQVVEAEKLYRLVVGQYAKPESNAGELIDSMKNFGIDQQTLDSKKAELASLTMVANVILNLDAFLTK